MSTFLSIGEFARATHLSVKALRHYDEVGLLTPTEVDRSSRYRRYALAQVPTAQVIRRFRDLDMPLERIKEMLTSPDRQTRDRILLEHLEQMEAKLGQTQATVASLRALLQGTAVTDAVEHRDVTSSHALAIREVVTWDDAEVWLGEALHELRGAAAASAVERTGPDGALYSQEFFEAHDGEVVAFVPTRVPVETAGRLVPLLLPGGPHAVILHRGPFSTLDVTYGALGSYVAEHALGGDGPVREHYLVDVAADPEDLRTEVCWPIRPSEVPLPPR